ncbi:MAG: pectate lyase [Prevotella sp.]|nr:pectate lyase [Prevotella sp.]
MKTKLLTLSLLLMLAVNAPAQLNERSRGLRETRPEFFTTDEARRIGEQVLLYQRVTGGWPKNINMARPLSDAERQQVQKDHDRKDDSTTDNGATTMQMTFLARLYQATHDERYRNAVNKAIEYLLGGQYENGGWPQFWPDPKGYQVHITYNDDAMVNTLKMLRDISNDASPYQQIADKGLKKRMRKAFDMGIECILKTQIVTDGQLTVWCQQHYRDSYLPAPARAFELPSYCSSETASIVGLLMSLPKPDARVKKAVHAAMQWLDSHKLTGLRQTYTAPWGDPKRDKLLIEDPTSTQVLWARYYDLVYGEPFVCDRDGIPRRRLSQIGHERRNGYGWYQDRAAELYPVYDAWADKYDPQHKVAISLTTKGGNENGTLQMYRRPVVSTTLFDAVVQPGQSIQAAIEGAPQYPAEPYKILIKKGSYNEKVIIDRPNIVLVGEQRDSTIIHWAELNSKREVKEYKGQPVGNGVIVLLERADDCVLSGLTVYNNYGTTVDSTTAHQMAVFGRATRTIILNSNIWADGNDALSLWAPEAGGMYYHADLYLRCAGVDFLCPRGWCYATRCRFDGDGHAIIWHDGRGDPDKKLVIVDSQFDALRPTPLGRYHHDAQFYLVHCKLSSNILDENIRYAYTDKVLDPCPWGQRTYYWACWRDGGHSGWLADNLRTAPGQPEYHTVTARWTFGDRWNPEARIRDLWSVLAY